ncbi:MAG: hypothetical protein EXQ86_07225 [Rhodospirillales bacterium]|nr:hypothetical protein [Rhodospirillales bacterium]
MFVDLRVAQLLCSRICHDLLSPAAGVNAGVEILAEGGEAGSEAVGLIGQSAAQVARRLAYYRVAFGLGSTADGVMDGFTEARDLAHGLLDGGNVTLNWADHASVPSIRDVPQSSPKLLLNMILVGAGALMRGGTLGLDFAELPEGLGVALRANGKGARLRDDVRSALSRDVDLDELSAHNVHGRLTRLLAESIGATFEIPEAASDEVRLAVLLPCIAVEPRPLPGPAARRPLVR